MNEEELNKISQIIKDSFGNLTSIVEELSSEDGFEDISIKKVKQILSDNDELQEVYSDALRAKDDIASEKIFELIQQGDRNAILEERRLASQNKTSDYDQVKEKVTVILIQKTNSSKEFSTHYMDLFGGTLKGAEKAIYRACAKFGLLTPTERVKQEKEDEDNSLANRFMRGELTEMQLLREQLHRALQDLDSASATARGNANKNAILIQQRLEEIEEREAKKHSKSLFEITTLLDSKLFGITPEDVERIEMEYNGKMIEAQDAV